MKICKVCSQEKPLEYYYNNHSSLDGKQGMCKECFKEKRKEDYRNKMKDESYRQERRKKAHLYRKKKKQKEQAKLRKNKKARKQYLDKFKSIKCAGGECPFKQDCSRYQLDITEPGLKFFTSPPYDGITCREFKGIGKMKIWEQLLRN